MRLQDQIKHFEPVQQLFLWFLKQCQCRQNNNKNPATNFPEKVFWKKCILRLQNQNNWYIYIYIKINILYYFTQYLIKQKKCKKKEIGFYKTDKNNIFLIYSVVIKQENSRILFSIPSNLSQADKIQTICSSSNSSSNKYSKIEANLFFPKKWSTLLYKDTIKTTGYNQNKKTLFQQKLKQHI